MSTMDDVLESWEEIEESEVITFFNKLNRILFSSRIDKKVIVLTYITEEIFKTLILADTIYIEPKYFKHYDHAKFDYHGEDVHILIIHEFLGSYTCACYVCSYILLLRG